MAGRSRSSPTVIDPPPVHRQSCLWGCVRVPGKTGVSVQYDGVGPRARARRKPRAEWLALQPGAHQGYVDWDRAEAIRKMVSENVPTPGARGAPEHGSALLSGLLRCCRCGRKLIVQSTQGPRVRFLVMHVFVENSIAGSRIASHSAGCVSTRHSPRNGFTAYFVISPAIGLSCHRHQRDAKHRRQLDAGVEASGPYDFAVRKPVLSSAAPPASTASRAQRP